MLNLLFSSLVLGFGLEAKTPVVPSPAAVPTTSTSLFNGPAAPAPEELEDLLKEFDQAQKAWIKKIQAASRAERGKLIEEDPTREYWPRFLGFADDGEPQAALWVVQHAAGAHLPPQELRDSVMGSFKLLFFDHLDKPELLGQAGEQLKAYAYTLPPEELVPVLRDSFERAELAESKALTAFFLGELLIDSKEDKQVQEGKAWLQRVQAEFADSNYAARAADRLFVLDHLGIGKIAPEFGGQSIDGDEIKLSDQRGKIVVVDFFGFW